MLEVHELIYQLNFYLELNIYKLQHKSFAEQEKVTKDFEINYLINYSTRNLN